MLILKTNIFGNLELRSCVKIGEQDVTLHLCKKEKEAVTSSHKNKKNIKTLDITREMKIKSYMEVFLFSFHLL